MIMIQSSCVLHLTQTAGPPARCVQPCFMHHPSTAARGIRDSGMWGLPLRRAAAAGTHQCARWCRQPAGRDQSQRPGVCQHPQGYGEQATEGRPSGDELGRVGTPE
jgi:hypothetical protein